MNDPIVGSVPKLSKQSFMTQSKLDSQCYLMFKRAQCFALWSPPAQEDIS